MYRVFACVFGLAVLFLLTGTVEAQPRNLKKHAYNIVNDSGQTIHLAIVGNKPWAIWRPSNRDGILFAAGNGKEEKADLVEGERAVMVWDRDGKLIWIEAVKIDAPGTIKFGKRVVVTNRAGKKMMTKTLHKE